MIQFEYFVLLLFTYFELNSGMQKFTVQKADIEKQDNDIIKAQIDLKKSNDQTLIDINAEILQDLGHEIFIQVRLQKKNPANGEYVELFDSAIVNRCDFLANRQKYPILNLLAHDLQDHGNLMDPCPIMKGKYYAKDFVFEAHGALEKLIAPGEYCLHYVMMKTAPEESNIILSIRFYATSP